MNYLIISAYFLIITIFIIIVNDIYSIKFLIKLETEHIFKKNSYFKKFNKNNLISRNIKNKNELENIYLNNCLTFSNNQKEIIKNIVYYIRKKTNNDNIFKYWKFGLVKNIEADLPHTHKDVIILSQNVLNDLQLNYGVILFIHEKTHILQRKYYSLFNDLYTNYWNFIKVKKIYNFDHLSKIVRLNPDGLDLTWIYKKDNKYILLLAVFNSLKLRDCSNVCVYLEKRNNKYFIPNNVRLIKLEKCNEFTSIFSITNNNYHPNELSAEYMSLYWFSLINNKDPINDIGNTLFKKWFIKNKKILL